MTDVPWLYLKVLQTEFAKLQATDLGELLPRCGQEGEDWVVGAESRAQTGEIHAPDEPRRDWIQPITFPPLKPLTSGRSLMISVDMSSSRNSF